MYKDSKEKLKHEKMNVGLIKVLEETYSTPFITSAIVSNKTQINRRTCDRYLEKLSQHKVIEDLGILNRQRVFANINLISILNNIRIH
jgi:Fic family protein